MLIALRQAQFTYLTPAPPRYRDGAAPSRGAATRPGMTYLREHFHKPGGVATGHRGQPLTANRDTDQTEVSS